MSAVLLPNGKQQYFTAAGIPLVGGKLYTFDTGTATPRTTWQDEAQTTPNANPITLDARGECTVYWSGSYRVRLDDPLGSTIWTRDGVSDQVYGAGLRADLAATGNGAKGAGLVSFDPTLTYTAGSIGLFLATIYQRTSVEATAGVTPVNYFYPPLWVNRYGNNTTPGTTSMRAAWQAAINVAKQGGGEIRWDASTGPHLIDGALDCTVPVGGNNKSYSFRGTGQVTAITLPSSAYAPDITLKHTGHAFDCTGTKGIFFENMTITTDAATYPQTCFLFARNTDASSMQVRLERVMVIGSFSKAIRYLYGCEESVAEGCQFFNRATDANAKVNIFTQKNIRSVTSTFTTIATLAQSSICYNDIGCSQLMFSNNAAADVYELDNVNFGNIIGGWAACANATGGGRSIIYINTTNGMASGWLINGLTCEASAPSPPANGVLFGTESAASGSGWTFINSAFPHTTRIIGGGNAGASLLNCSMYNLGCQGVGAGGVNFAGTLAAYDGGVEGTITAGTLLTPNFHRLGMHLQTLAECRVVMRDDSSAANAKGIALRQTGGQFVISLLDDTNAPTGNILLLARAGGAATRLTLAAPLYALPNLQASATFANDAAAAAGGVAVGDLYRNGSVVQCRIV